MATSHARTVPEADHPGIGKAAQNGILIRSGDALQTAKRLTTVVLDKTGTVTVGKPSLTDVVAAGGLDDREVLRLAASVERASEHPLAEAIVQAAKGRGVELAQPTDFHAIAGHGVQARVQGRAVLLGNRKLLADRGMRSATFRRAGPRRVPPEGAGHLRVHLPDGDAARPAGRGDGVVRRP